MRNRIFKSVLHVVSNILYAGSLLFVFLEIPRFIDPGPIAVGVLILFAVQAAILFVLLNRTIDDHVDRLMDRKDNQQHGS